MPNKNKVPRPRNDGWGKRTRRNLKQALIVPLGPSCIDSPRANARLRTSIPARARHKLTPAVVSLVGWLQLVFSGCSESPEETASLSDFDVPASLPTWDEFRAESTRSAPDGSTYYVVEWDIPISDEDDLRDYYNRLVAPQTEKGVVFLVPGTTDDDIWPNDDELHLRYCVDTDTTTGFGAPSSNVTAATMIAAMDQATRAWQDVANVRFEYDSANNGNCGTASPIPDSRYIKISRAEFLLSPCAFAPVSHRTCPYLDGNTIGVNSSYIGGNAPPGFTWPGTMMHELGHVLGLAHEHYHSSGGGCSTRDTRDVTASVDLASIMGYPLGFVGGCALTTPNLTALSEGDGITARILYGMPAAWYVPLLMG